MQNPSVSDEVQAGTARPATAVTEDDAATLRSMGYKQELARRMGAFSSFALSLSIICILAGCLTSFHLAFSSAGPGAISLGWPLGCLLSLCCAVTMAQIASAFPTAGGLYHWSSILGSRGWGWLTAWFNIMGLVTVLAAINVGTYQFLRGALGVLSTSGAAEAPVSPQLLAMWQLAGVALITLSQALFNHLGIRLTTRLTDFSGYLILLVASVLTISLLVYAKSLDWSRLWTFTNYSGAAGGGVWPQSGSLLRGFLLALLLPAYTVTGFDAPAHTSEETVGATRAVPRGIINSVIVSGVFGWILLCAIVLAIPDLHGAAAQGDRAFFFIAARVLPRGLLSILFAGIIVAQYLCGLATLTSTSRVVYAFARDGGLPWSSRLRTVSDRYKTPVPAIWASAIFSVLFTVYTPVYSTITAVCVIFLYVSYIIPAVLGLRAYGRTWTVMGPFHIGRWYRVLSAVCVLGCVLLIGIGIQPPNDAALWIVLGALLLTAVVWFGFERRRFAGPPMIRERT